MLKFSAHALSLMMAFTPAVVRAQAALHSLPAFPLAQGGPVIRQSVQAGEPFTVAGPQGVVVGQQQGVAEAWILPVKLLSQMTLEAEVEGYSVPLQLNGMARELEVRPDRTTITYSHIAVTVHETIFAPAQSPEGTGAVVLFQVDAVRPVTLTLRFTPELREMWPKPSSGSPSAEWVARGASGLYLLHTDFPGLTGAVALPGAHSGIMAPYQERPQVHPLELILRVDPVHDRTRVFPLLMAVATTPATATSEALERTLADLNERIPALYAQHSASYAKSQHELTSIVTPDKALDAALTWAETSIAQLQARTRPTDAMPQGEVGLVAGYYASGDSARPGFGWYFGRDTLYTTYAINAYGDFALTRTALEFLLRRQRADGKIMHEFSQTAGLVDWAALPYEYAAADATPLFLTALRDYVRSSGDLAWLQAHADAVRKAWHFETTHDADGDGIYDNAEGTGWVESWPTGMPKQEIYLALLDEQASHAVAELAPLLNDAALGQQAQARGTRLHDLIEQEYYRPATQTYAFSRNDGGALDTTATVFPAVAWWSMEPAAGESLDHPAAMLRQWASHSFATDWGVRDVSETEPVYDATSYHQGSVWPLYTGWAALAQYRSGHPLAGYAATMQNVDLTVAQDPGAVTELLSGAFFEPFGRSTSHQLWSSAMVVVPVLRGLFGVEVDALQHAVHVTPHLPADWPAAQVHQLHVGGSIVDLDYLRRGREMVVTLHTVSGPAVHLDHGKDTLTVLLPPVEVSLGHGLPARGARTAQPKVLAEERAPGMLRLELEAMAESDVLLHVQRNDVRAKLRVEDGELSGDQLHVHFGPRQSLAHDEYVTRTVTLRW